MMDTFVIGNGRMAGFTRFFRQFWHVMLATVALVSIGEYVKYVFFPELNGMYPHITSIFFGSIAAFLAASYVMGRYVKKNNQLHDRISEFNYFDALTGLPNRGLLNDRLNLIMAQSRREGRQAGVLSIDLDRFKWINDSLGYCDGDVLLQTIAGRLRSRLRASDTVSRPGGDEFVIILSAIKHEQDLVHAIQDIMSLLSMPVEIDGREIFVSASVGIAIFPVDGNDAGTLLRNADTAMYAAKEAGRNNYKFFSSEMNARAIERMTLETNLRGALERNEFFLTYQPQLDLRTGKIVGVEALLGWNCPGKGPVSADKFIPIAEETGLIMPMGDWVLRQACQEGKLWQDAGFGDVRMAVNISGCQFRHAGLAKTVADILAETGIDPGRLEIELTESVLLENSDNAVAMLMELKSLGIRLVMDDFGTGYSSLTYLKHFPIDRLKIDQLFIRDVNTTQDDASLVEAIIAMANSLGLEVIAEGVETGEQVTFLKTSNCFEMQGYYFSRPVGSKEIRDMLASGLSIQTADTIFP